MFTIGELQAVAQKVLKEAGHRKCFAFFAEMGVGKTTLINTLCEELGVKDTTSSPTYSIINEYKTCNGDRVVHMDWYRLKDENDALNAGVEDYLQGDNYCFIEWPERAADLLPAQTVKVYLSLEESSNKRKCYIETLN